MGQRDEHDLKERQDQNILIIRSGALGDTLLLLPALIALPKRDRVFFAGRQPGIDFLNHVGYKAMNLDIGGWHRLFMKTPGEERNVVLPVSGVNRAVVFSADRTEILKQNLKASFPSASVFLFPPFPPKSQPIHVARYLARCLQSANPLLNEENVMETASVKAALQGPWNLKERYRLVIHPGSGDPQKNHPIHFWTEIIKRFRESQRFGHLRTVLLLGPAEREMATLFRESEAPFQTVETFISPSPKVLLDVLGTAALYLGHDSGVTHLSGLMGTPTVALFRNSDPLQWRPLGPIVRVIHRPQSDLKCLAQIMGAAETL